MYKTSELRIDKWDDSYLRKADIRPLAVVLVIDKDQYTSSNSSFDPSTPITFEKD